MSSKSNGPIGENTGLKKSLSTISNHIVLSQFTEAAQMEHHMGTH